MEAPNKRGVATAGRAKQLGAPPGRLNGFSTKDRLSLPASAVHDSECIASVRVPRERTSFGLHQDSAFCDFFGRAFLA